MKNELYLITSKSKLWNEPDTIIFLKIRIKIPQSYHLYGRLTLAFFLIQTLTRLVLILNKSSIIWSTPKILAMGILWDIHAWAFLGLPFFLFSLLLTGKVSGVINRGYFSKILAGILIYVLSFVAFCELTFWDEFRSRFNFITVDYLIYTNEVIANINESFPMPTIYTGILIFTVLIVFIIFRLKFETIETPFFQRWPALVLFAFIIPLSTIAVLGPFLNTAESNFPRDQLARNGWVEFYRAFRSNSIDYENFYPTISGNEAESFVREKLKNKSHFVTGNKTPPNVVLIVVESLGAKFIKPLGGQEDTTPFLNELSDRSVFFENLYSTGTRTVRGLEAINLSVPPTPGYAVVKRPDHKGLFSMGRTFQNNNYEPIFLYGGRGFFDNMNSFFEGNGFHTVDQTSFSAAETTFSNAWGVCDEDLFHKAISIMDSPTNLKPKMLFILTTSNHRPFTYPGGRIDIPSGTGRSGAVKYTDFAIGEFMRESMKKPWAKNTVFVIIADHSTEGRGRFDLEMADFHIPMWIVAPELPPQRIRKLVSQIDLLPSLIDLLKLKDDSPFFGKSFFSQHNTEERAFIGNYQYVGYYKGGTLTTLGPNKKIRSYSYDPQLRKQKNVASSPYVNEAISYYQFASSILKAGKYSPAP